jgi:hypothetical protein
MSNTTKLQLPYPELADPADVPQWNKALALRLDSISVTYNQGLSNVRPAPTTQGMIWYSTDIDVFSYSDGLAWHDIGSVAANYITLAMLAPKLKVATGTATPTDESVRALGQTASTAAAGNDPRFPTLDQKDALAGTGGMPSAINKYVTDQDARLSQVVSVLPSSPIAGQQVLYIADAVNHIYWNMVYLGGVWVFIGGSPLLKTVATREQTNSTTYTDLTTVGPSVTAPLKGTYRIETGFQGEAYNDNCVLFMSYTIAGAAAIDTDAVTASGQSPGNDSVATIREKTFASPATAIVAKYRRLNPPPNATIYISNRWLKLTPIFINP